jgi:hypothetical protein
MTDGPWNDFKPQAAQAGPWDDFKKPDVNAADKEGVVYDVLKSGGVGLAKGGIGLAGAAGDARNLASAATDYIGKKIGASPEAVQGFKDKAASAADYLPGGAGTILANAPSSGDIQKSVEGVTGEFHKPQTVPGQYAQTLGEFAPGALGGGEGLLARALTRVALPAAASETAGQLTKGTVAEPYARLAGALASPSIAAAGRRVITPLPANPARSALVDVLANEGVNLTAGQRTGSKPLQWAESTFGDMPGAGGRPAEMMTNQQEQFTAAALRRAGETAPRATPEVVDNAFTRIGNQFDTIGARNHVQPDQQFVQDLQAARDEYHNLVGPHARAPVIDNTIADIGNQMQRNGGILTGEQYNAMTSRLARQARNARADPQLQDTLQGLRDSLDDAFERTLQRTGNIPDLNALREARNQYRNLLVVEKAATGAGSATAEGLLSPSQLKNAVVQQNRRSYARGQGDFADLARAGEAIMRPLPQSGTAPRQNMQHLLSVIGSLVGGTAGSAAGPAGAATGVAAGLAAPIAAGRALMSRPAQAYLGNQLVQPGPRDTTSRALTRALLAAQGGGGLVTQGDDGRPRLVVQPSNPARLAGPQP